MLNYLNLVMTALQIDAVHLEERKEMWLCRIAHGKGLTVMIWKVANDATKKILSLLNESVAGFSQIDETNRQQLEDKICEQIMESIRDGFKDLYPREFN